MDKEIIEKNKQRLLAEKTRLERLLGAVAHREKDVTREEFSSDFPNVGDSLDDNAIEVSLYEANLAEEKSLEQRLHKVVAALARIADGSYGICQVGGEPIDPARLEAAPEADVCVNHSN